MLSDWKVAFCRRFSSHTTSPPHHHHLTPPATSLHPPPRPTPHSHSPPHNPITIVFFIPTIAVVWFRHRWPLHGAPLCQCHVVAAGSMTTCLCQCGDLCVDVTWLPAAPSFDVAFTCSKYWFFKFSPRPSFHVAALKSLKITPPAIRRGCRAARVSHARLGMWTRHVGWMCQRQQLIMTSI